VKRKHGKLKTLLVGFDAACWSYLDTLVQSGRLPTLKRLMENGSWGQLESTMPALTPIAWGSISTGKNPGKHGIFELIWKHPGSYDFTPPSAKNRIGTPFWKRLNEGGVRVGLVNIPLTYPPEPIDGFVVCGFGTPESAQQITHPWEIRDDIDSRHGKYSPAVSPELLRMGSPSDIYRAERQLQAQHVQIALDLSNEFEVEVLIINLMLIDHANHYMPKVDEVQQAICDTDTDLEMLIDGFNPDNVLVISDHGSQRAQGTFLLYNWLKDRGYITPQKRTLAEQRAALNWVVANWLEGKSKTLEKILRHLIVAGIMYLPQAGKQSLMKRIRTRFPFVDDYIDFKETAFNPSSKVFGGSPFSGVLYLNLAGREPSGILSDLEYQQLIAELSKKLAEIEEPDTGKKLFQTVAQPKDLYEGPLLDCAPEIILDAYANEWKIRVSPPGLVEGTPENEYFVRDQSVFGWHSKDGIIVFSGVDAGKTGNSVQGNLLDVAATLLFLYGIPIPEDYDGRVLVEAIAPEFLENQPLETQPGDTLTSATTYDFSYSEEEEEQLMRHLRSLGYI
jgi:predicted AlkP superfamily phosphohydrolase/phosphomutase